MPERLAAPSYGLSEEEVLAKALASSAGGEYANLMLGDWSAYPSKSQGEFVLITTFAWWCGGNRRLVDLLFSRSLLCDDKWDRDDYRERTIDVACAFIECAGGYYEQGRGMDDGPTGLLARLLG